jgi:glycosyltransferase involved in cell wall biosynthesis
VAIIGRLVRQKGIDILLQAIANVPEVRLTIAGKGELEPDLRCTVTELGLDDRVEFVGWVDPASIFQRVDAVALPSRNEGLPLVLLEAMHVGLPVVASSVGSVAEAIEDGKTGLLVPPEDSQTLARALAGLAESPPRRRRLGAAAQHRAQQHFSPAAMAAGYHMIYSSVISSGSTRERSGGHQ